MRENVLNLKFLQQQMKDMLEHKISTIIDETNMSQQIIFATIHEKNL
jgi:hypothetical protein